MGLGGGGEAGKPGGQGWKPDADAVERAGRGGDEHVVLRALSVIPFVLAAAVCVIALVSWLLIALLGLGEADPVWRWVQYHGFLGGLGQALFAIGMALIPLALGALAVWAAIHGFRPDPHPYFWPAAQLLFGLAAVALVVVDHTSWIDLHELGMDAMDWWFAFGCVAFAMILAGMRIRLRRRGA